jgi:hypothetical protein
MPASILLNIPARASLSDILSLEGVTAVVGIIMPQSWTAANVTIQGSPFGVNFYDLHDGLPGTELMFNVRPGVMVNINPNRLRCCAAIRLRSGTHSAPIAQAAARTFGIVIEGDSPLAVPMLDEPEA